MSGVFYGIGVNVVVGFVNDGILVLSPEKYSPADKAGVLANDLIIKIDGKVVAETTYTDAANMLKGEKGSEVVITVKRGEEILDITIERGPIVVPTVDYEIYDGIGYIVINAFRANTDDFFIEAVDHMKENNVKAIIYDVRDNGGGYLDTVVNMLDYIAKDGTELVSFSNGYRSPIKANDDHSLSIPSVVICNKNSASASELFVQGMRDLGESGYFPVTVVGQKTYGKFVLQNTYTMTDGSAVTFTVAYYYSPLGKQFNGIGIEPDVDLTAGLTASEIRNLTDEFYIENAIIEANKLLENK